MGTARLRVDQGILAFAFWPDDRTLAACCWDGSVRFWERATGREGRRLQIPLSSPRAAVFIPDKQTVALLDGEKDFFLWDTAKGERVWSISLPEYYDRAYFCIALSPHGELLALPEDEKKVGLYDSTTGRKIRTVEEAEGRTLVFSPDGKFLAIAARKPPAHLWDIRSGKKIRDLPSTERFIDPRRGREGTAIDFSRDGRMVAVGNSHSVVVSEVATGKEVSRLKLKQAPGYDITQGSLLFSADGKTLITGHYAGLIRFWDRASGKERFSCQINGLFTALPVMSRDGKVLSVVPGDYRFIRLLDPATGKDVGPPADGHEFQLNFVAFSPDGKTLLSGDRHTIREWKTEKGEPGWQYSAGNFHEENTILSADGKRLAQPDYTQVELLHLGWEKKVQMLKYDGEDVIQAVAFSPEGKWLVSAHNHSSPENGKGKIRGHDSLHFWDLATGKELPEKEIRSSATPTTDRYSRLVITPDGLMAIAGSVDGKVNRGKGFVEIWRSSKEAGQLYLWDLLSGRPIRTLEGHGGTIHSLVLSGDGRLLASGSADRSVRLWELASGKTLFTLPMAKSIFRASALSLSDWSNEPVFSLSPDGWLLATGSESTLRLYSTVTGKAVLKLRGHNSEIRCLAFSPDSLRLASGFRDGTALVWDVAAACRAVRPAPRQLNAREIELFWASLADTDVNKSHRAAWGLIAGENAAVQMLKGKLRPVESVEPKRIQRLLADLDADLFAVREAAMRALAKMGERAEPAMIAALRDRPSLEARKRIEELLARSQKREWNPEQLREMRALSVLEHVGTAEAREILNSLANGSPDAWLTQKAKASLARISCRKSEPRP